MEYRNLYLEWTNALKAPEFDIEQLAEIHRLHQARLQAEEESRQRWRVADAAWRAEMAEVEARVRAELAGLSKADLRRRYIARNGWAPEPNDRYWTRERYVDDIVDRECLKVPTTHDRLH